MKGKKHGHCVCCRKVKVGLKVNKNWVCMSCNKMKNVMYYLEMGCLPVWYDKKEEVHFFQRSCKTFQAVRKL